MTTPCRFCGSPLNAVFADLGMSPLANSYLTPEQCNGMEPFYPLRALVCERCFLVQLEEYESPSSIFSDYAYFSSYSTSWLEHSRRYAAAMVERFGLGPDSHVVEIASQRRLSPAVLQGARHPRARHRAGRERRRGRRREGSPDARASSSASRRRAASRPNSSADLLIGNNVLAHVPDINDFVGGMKMLLKPGGVITMEFPHLMRLIDERQWDTIYHEHFSYLSFTTARRVFAAHGLRLFDVEELPTHGGSLRIYGCHDDDAGKPETDARRRADRARGRRRVLGRSRPTSTTASRWPRTSAGSSPP